MAMMQCPECGMTTEGSPPMDCPMDGTPMQPVDPMQPPK